MAESLIQFKIDSDLKNKYKGRLLEFCDGKTMKEDLLEYIKQKTWFLDPKPSEPPVRESEPEPTEQAEDLETPGSVETLAALEAELMRIDGVDEISGVYVEEFGYVEPGDPEYPEALRAYVENHRKGPENDPEPVATGEPETLENEDSEPKTRPPEDPNESFGFPDDEPVATVEPAATVEPDGDIPPRASLPLPLDPEDEPDPGVEPEPKGDGL